MLLNQKPTVLFYSVTSIAILVILLFFGKVTYFAKWPEVVWLEPPRELLSNKFLSATHSDGRQIKLHLEINAMLPNLSPINISVITKNIKAEKVSVDFSAKETFTPDNRPPLKPLKYNNFIKHNKFFGRTLIPTKDRSRTWNATVIIQTTECEIRAPFEFTIDSLTQHQPKIKTNSTGTQ